MRELTGLNNSEIGEMFDMKFSAVSKAALSIEIEIKKDKGLRKEVKRLISNFEA
jgi:chromosomal replication initiation ATPase DnaA